LSNNDTDTNGLDDVYDVLPLLIDTDNDGILDYLDLDSDKIRWKYQTNQQC